VAPFSLEPASCRGIRRGRLVAGATRLQTRLNLVLFPNVPVVKAVIADTILAQKPACGSIRPFKANYGRPELALARRVVAKVEWHRGELFPRVGFIVTNLSYPPKGIVRFYNGRGTAEQWIKEGKYALNWTRLSCHKFVANQVRLWLFVLAYNLGNFLRRLVLPEGMKHWTLTSLQTRLIKTGGRLVRHARMLVFQLAEVLVTREMLTGILERISRLRLAPG